MLRVSIACWEIMQELIVECELCSLDESDRRSTPESPVENRICLHLLSLELIFISYHRRPVVLHSLKAVALVYFDASSYMYWRFSARRLQSLLLSYTASAVPHFASGRMVWWRVCEICCIWLFRAAACMPRCAAVTGETLELVWYWKWDFFHFCSSLMLKANGLLWITWWWCGG